MDFEGQARFELLGWVVLAILGAVCFVIGYAAQDFGLMCKMYGGGAHQHVAAAVAKYECIMVAKSSCLQQVALHTL
jgi:Microsomal signal peptidase 12 kDa subunit (SPC12)